MYGAFYFLQDCYLFFVTCHTKIFGSWIPESPKLALRKLRDNTFTNLHSTIKHNFVTVKRVQSLAFFQAPRWKQWPKPLHSRLQPEVWGYTWSLTSGALPPCQLINNCRCDGNGLLICGNVWQSGMKFDKGDLQTSNSTLEPKASTTSPKYS